MKIFAKEVLMSRAKQIVTELLSKADIKINGDRPFDIQVHNEDLYDRVLKQTSLGLGESYMEGWWDCEALDQLFDRILKARLDEQVQGDLSIQLKILKTRLFNLQNRKRAFEVGKKHYDVGNDLYQRMLDKRLNYTSAYWRTAKTLDEAQEAKLELVCRKLNLQAGMKVLELGCGWGSFAKFAAEKYGVEVTGLTVSKEQVELGRKLCKGLPVQLELADYRTANGQYDRVISIGLMEHVGYKNYRTYMDVVNRTLKEDGIGFIHTIGSNQSVTTANQWTTKYIFPNGMLPSIAQLSKAMEGLFVVEDLHNFGPDYDKTLMAWYANFEAAWPELKDKYGQRFYRMWRYYLLSSAGGFRSRQTQLWQIVFTKMGQPQPDCRKI